LNLTTTERGYANGIFPMLGDSVVKLTPPPDAFENRRQKIDFNNALKHRELLLCHLSMLLKTTGKKWY